MEESELTKHHISSKHFELKDLPTSSSSTSGSATQLLKKNEKSGEGKKRMTKKKKRSKKQIERSRKYMENKILSKIHNAMVTDPMIPSGTEYCAMARITSATGMHYHNSVYNLPYDATDSRCHTVEGIGQYLNTRPVRTTASLSAPDGSSLHFVMHWPPPPIRSITNAIVPSSERCWQGQVSSLAKPTILQKANSSLRATADAFIPSAALYPHGNLLSKTIVMPDAAGPQDGFISEAKKNLIPASQMGPHLSVSVLNPCADKFLPFSNIKVSDSTTDISPNAYITDQNKFIHDTKEKAFAKVEVKTDTSTNENLVVSDEKIKTEGMPDETVNNKEVPNEEIKLEIDTDKKEETESIPYEEADVELKADEVKESVPSEGSYTAGSDDVSTDDSRAAVGEFKPGIIPNDATDDDVFGILKIYAESSLHSNIAEAARFNTDKKSETSEDYGYTYFSLSNLTVI